MRLLFVVISLLSLPVAAQDVTVAQAEAMIKQGKNLEQIPKSVWKQLLTPEQFKILWRAGTERPFTGELLKEKRDGVYVTAGCRIPVFSSKHKYKSGTGWPSFFDHIPGRLATKTDYKLIYPRREYHCSRCLGHQGHVFNDGPKPTGQRWCNNGAALIFTLDAV